MGKTRPETAWKENSITRKNKEIKACPIHKPETVQGPEEIQRREHQHQRPMRSAVLREVDDSKS